MSLINISTEPLPSLPTRAADSHKGDYGRVLVLGGSRGMSGAPALAGMAALRSGAGLVTLAVPAHIQSTVASFEPAYMTLSCGSEESASIPSGERERLLRVAGNMSAVALGPGMGTDPSTVTLVHRLFQELTVPTIVDADGLNALSKDITLLSNSPAPRILTPHPGEFARLAGTQCSNDEEERITQAAELCCRDESGNTIVVLKGHRTIVTDGNQYSLNTTGNPGMATGGTGDCLTGIIVALSGQGLDPFEAARFGAHVHGLAGDLAAAQMGQISMTARDLIEFLPQAFLQCQ